MSSDTIVCMGRRFDVRLEGMVESTASLALRVQDCAMQVTFVGKDLLPLLNVSVVVNLAHEHHAL